MPKKKKVCPICDSKGYIKDKENYKIKLCKCIESQCKCNGKSNYFYLDKDTMTFKECICKPYRIKVNKINYNFKKSDIPDIYKWKFFEDFDIIHKGKPNTYLKKVSDLISEVITNYSNPKKRKGLLLWSLLTGNGKTLSCSIILNTLMFEYGATGKFMKLSSDYFGRLKNSYSDKFETEKDIIKQLINYDVLVIDDFGTERGTEWEKEKLYELIDGRNMNKKLTLVSTNNDLTDFKKIAKYSRIYSRLGEMCKIHNVKAPSFRELEIEIS